MADPVTAATAFWDLEASEILKFVSEFVSAVAWPLAAVFIVGFFKKEITERIPGLSELTLPGGISAKFNNGLAQVEANVASETTAAKAEGDAAGPVLEFGTKNQIHVDAANDAAAVRTSLEELDPIALRANPTGVVMESWKVIEEKLRMLAARHLPSTPSSPRSTTVHNLLSVLGSAGVLTNSEIHALFEMYSLRNLVAHTKKAISDDEALRFRQLAENLVKKYSSLLL